MRKSIVLAAMLGGILVSGTAFAAKAPKPTVSPKHSSEMSTTGEDIGVITAIDAKDHTITLADGKSYVLPGYFKLDGLEPGDAVSVTYSVDISGNAGSAMSVKAM